MGAKRVQEPEKTEAPPPGSGPAVRARGSPSFRPALMQRVSHCDRTRRLGVCRPRLQARLAGPGARGRPSLGHQPRRKSGGGKGGERLHRAAHDRAAGLAGEGAEAGRQRLRVARPRGCGRPSRPGRARGPGGTSLAACAHALSARAGAGRTASPAAIHSPTAAEPAGHRSPQRVLGCGATVPAPTSPRDLTSPSRIKPVPSWSAPRSIPSPSSYQPGLPS